ncbi:MAG: S8 family serine peptidase [Myxococcales bacterium]|nr:S8 family serine peptidase [Myxococcales bacterium]
MSKRSRTLPLTLALLTLGAAAPAWSAPATDGLVIDLADDTTDADEAAIEAKLGGLDIKLNSIHSADERFFVADVPPERMAEAIQALAGDPRVESAEPNYLFSIPEAETEVSPPEVTPSHPGFPNDPMFEQQWSFPMVGAKDAWKVADGKGVVVAVIDTGVAYEDYGRFKRVEDLAGTEFVKGYDFVNDTDHPNDDHGHGTHVAGTIAQTTNNGIGVAGLAPGAKIMPLKVLSAAGSGSVADIADAIRFAADEGANVINMSLGGGMRTLIMERAVAYAHNKGVVVVCAAGNGGRKKVEYPAAYKGAFAVSSVGPTRKLAYYSSYGKQVAISAPGGDRQLGEAATIIQNTIEPRRIDATNLYLGFQGTSMATPHVAGAAALVMSAGVTNPDDVERILKDTASEAGPKGWDERFGYGILNAGAAVKQAAAEANGGWHLGASLLAVLAFAWRNRRRLALAKLLPGALAGAVVGGSGLFFLAGLLPAVFTTAMPNWDLAAFGVHTALWASALPVFGLSVVLLGARRLRPLLVGLALGWAAHFVVAGLFGVTDVAFVPGVASALDQAWLLVNGAALALLATLVARVMAR